MSKFSNYSIVQIKALRDRVKKTLKSCTSMQVAAQEFVKELHEEFEESAVLVRLFGTVAFEKLPETDKNFVTQLADSRGCAGELNDRTIVISLLGTRGKRPNWNDRKMSGARLGVPLLSASFVKTIPMVSRLMSDIGTGIHWVEKQETQILVKSMGQMARLLYVEDAKTAVSGEGFKIVPAQDFVTSNNITSVFGLGGAYLNRTFVSVICFSSERITQQQAQLFMPLVNTFKTATMNLVMSGKIFD